MLQALFLPSKLVMPRIPQNADGGGVVGQTASIRTHICTLNKPVYDITKFGL